MINKYRSDWEAFYKQGRISKERLDEENKRYDGIIRMIKQINRVDYESSRLFWHQCIENLMEERFCFEEIKELTNTDQNLNSYLLNNNFKDSAYVDINNPDERNYYYFLCRYYTWYNSGDRPKYMVEKKDFWGSVRTTFVPAFTSFNFERLHQKIFDRFSKIEKQYLDFFNTSVMSTINDIRDVALDYYQTSLELEKVFYLPVSYRKTIYLIEMINMLESGKASSWKELVNLFDTYLYRESVIESLEQIGKRLVSIENRLSESNRQLLNINANLSGINDKLSSLNTKMNSIVKNTDKIRKYTNITMWSVV